MIRSDKNYRNILDYGLLKYQEKTKKENSEELLRVQPYQGYRLWNSRKLMDKLQGSLVVFMICLLMLIPASIITPFITNSSADTVMNSIGFFWLLGVLVILTIFIFFDFKDYIFRRKSSYAFLTEGILFEIGYFEKKKYLLKWKNLESFRLDKKDFKIYLKTKNEVDIKTHSLNAYDKGKLFLELEEDTVEPAHAMILEQLKKI